MEKKYIRYKAYGNLRKLLLEKLRDIGVERPSSSTLVSLNLKAYEELVSSVQDPEISYNDSMQMLVEKKLLAQKNKMYTIMLFEAVKAYQEEFEKSDRPTIKQVEKKTQQVLNIVIEDLLLL